jgi:hypothetical protein
MARRRVIFLLGAFLLSTTTSAHACSCLTSPTKDRIANTPVVFMGRVTDIRPSENSNHATAVTLRIEESYKGPRESDLVIDTPINTCGIEFKTGEKYLVFAAPLNSGELSSDLCSGTRKFQDVTSEDMAELSAAGKK